MCCKVTLPPPPPLYLLHLSTNSANRWMLRFLGLELFQFSGSSIPSQFGESGRWQGSGGIKNNSKDNDQAHTLLCQSFMPPLPSTSSELAEWLALIPVWRTGFSPSKTVMGKMEIAFQWRTSPPQYCNLGQCYCKWDCLKKMNKKMGQQPSWTTGRGRGFGKMADRHKVWDTPCHLPILLLEAMASPS